MSNTKRALLVAFHFPPLGAGSGLHRTVSLVRYLRESGWEPLVLSAHPQAYERTTPIAAGSFPDGLIVERAFSLDAARHLAVRGRYPRFLALPDRWSSWLVGALPAGLRMIRRYRPAVIWTTYPLASAHLIGAALHRLTGLPWIADFRDPMVEQIDGQWFPGDASVRRARLFVERRVARSAAAATFCTNTALQIFSERHGWPQGDSRAHVIENGYDPLPFEKAAQLPSRRDPDRLTLVHSGTLYPGPDRDPSALLEAISRLRERACLPANLRIVLRATGFDAVYRPLIDRLKLADVVELAPPIDYLSALREMLDADGLLLFQGHTSNPAIPAKAYEYLRARRPVLALADEGGETVRLLRRAGIGTVAPINDSMKIEQVLESFLARIGLAAHAVLDADAAERFSRVHRVREFAALFDAASRQK